MKKLILALIKERGHNGLRRATRAHSDIGWKTTANLAACKFDNWGYGDSDYIAKSQISSLPEEKINEIARHIAPNRGTHPAEWRKPLTAAEKAIAEALERRTQA